MVSNFLQTLRQPGACQFGTWVKLGTPETLECLAIAGFDFIVVDMEHAPHTFETAYRTIVMAQGLGMKALVRLPDSQGANVQRILDSGADGVLIPRVRSVEEARQIADGMIFSPKGSRGLGITSRAGHWGLKPTPQYVQEGNELVMRAPQLEDASALQQVEQILDVPGVNAIFVGPGDLALSTGKPATDPSNAALIDNLVRVANARNVPCGTAVGDAAAAVKAKERGFNFVMVSNDLSLFAKSAQTLMKGVKG
jgi:2-keto-3-deoxy-L-rhamnonate aldolase RhmA